MPKDFQQLEQLMKDAEVKQMMVLHQAEDQQDLTALMAALSSSLSQSARLLAEERGWDIDEIRQAIDSFMLEHPEAQ